jgi:hypothetical protein
VWLCLEGLARARVATLIEVLAAAHGAPVFEPHVTVLGRVEGDPDDLMARLHRLAVVTSPFRVRLTEVAMEDAFHRALYVQVRSTALLTLRARAAAAFGVPAGDDGYAPHASLLYADLPRAAKESDLARIGRRFGLRFEARRLELWDTTGEVTAWTRIGSASLGGEPEEGDDDDAA